MASVNTFKCFVGPDGTEGFFGVAAYERALMAGFTPKEIKAHLEREGILPGEKLKQLIF